ncbi:MAG: O-antigen ligase family protein [Acidobacteriota bacterium]
MPGLIPPLLLLLFGAWCGTFAGSAGFAGSTVGILALLGTLAMAGTPWPDPLGLGRVGRLLPGALWIVSAVSAWRSPVPRASWAVLILLPAFLMMPGAVARCWRDEAGRRLGARAVAVLTIAVSLWALIDWRVRDLPRVAMPLGHHNLLAAWLVILLPLALVAAREPGVWRWVGLAGGFLPAVTILATKSLAGNLALAAEALAVLFVLARTRRSWIVGLLVVLALISGLGLYAQRARIASILAGTDLSMQGRMVYYKGAWAGFLARPWLGWGPGSAAWTAPAFFEPVPGVSPIGESVGELHSLPLHLAYEVGAVGLVLSVALALAFLVRRLAGKREDSTFLLAGLAGLLGAAVAALGSAALAIQALPLAAAVAAGAALAGDRAPAVSRRPVLIYGALALLALAPLQAARWYYDRAVGGRGVRVALQRAVRIDPLFPLYRMRLALLDESPGMALEAARDGRAVPTLWTVAGLLGSSEALETACALDPLNPFPPFYRMALEPLAPEAPLRGARALLAEPRLAAATFWEERPDLLARSVEEVRRWPGVDAGWKETFLASLPAPGERRGVTGRLQLEIDTTPDLALSLHTFRRRPFPVQWPLVQLRTAPLAKLDLPPATTLRGTPAGTFSAGCPTPARSPGGQSLLIP